MGFLISPGIIVLVALVILILIVVFKVLFKKKRPDVFYTPFDYITGQTDEEFYEEEENTKDDIRKNK